MDRNLRDDNSEKESDWEQRTGVPIEPDQYKLFKLSNPIKYEHRYGADNPCNLRQFVEKYIKCYRHEYTTQYNSDKKEVAKMLAKTYPHLLTGEAAQTFELFDWAVEEEMKVHRPSPRQKELYNEAQSRYWAKYFKKEKGVDEKNEAEEKAKQEAEEKAISKSTF
jgi:hypothetical protein